jgi:hypothetical protein
MNFTKIHYVLLFQVQNYLFKIFDGMAKSRFQGLFLHVLKNYSCHQALTPFYFWNIRGRRHFIFSPTIS